MSFLAYGVAVWMFLAGLYGLVARRHLIGLVQSLAVVQSSTYVLFLAIGYRTGATAPYFSDIPRGTPTVDPIVQALVLTDIVVGAVVLSMLLSIAVQAHKEFGTLDVDELHALRR